MYSQGLGTIIHRHSRCSCSCLPLNLTSSVNPCWCISSSLSHSFASISIRRKEVPHSCSQLWSRLWCFAFYGSSNVTLEPVFCTPGEAPLVSPPSQESHSLPTGTVRKTPTTVQNLLWLPASSPGPGVQYPTENLSENSLYVHETSCYLNIQDKSHGIPKCPVITLQTYLKAQPLFHCKFPLCFDESQLTRLLNLSFLFILLTYLMGTYIPYFPISRAILHLWVYHIKMHIEFFA